MNILYAIQGTGNGHLSRARALVPELEHLGTIDLLISGRSCELTAGKPIKYSMHGLGYRFGTNGSIDFKASVLDFKPFELLQEVRSLPIENYDVVISDFEPVASWAARRAGKPVIGLSHQSSFHSEKVPRPGRVSRVAERIMKHYAQFTHPVGFHFRRYDSYIFPPVISAEIQKLKQAPPAANAYGTRKHITVYLPAYDPMLLAAHFIEIHDFDWHIFSKTASKEEHMGHVVIKPIDSNSYAESLVLSSGVICGAGFEAPSEALYLNKPLMVIPMRWQYEQQCNAAALALEGVTVCAAIDEHFNVRLLSWLDRASVSSLEIPGSHADVVQQLGELVHRLAQPVIRTTRKPVSASRAALW